MDYDDSLTLEYLRDKDPSAYLIPELLSDDDQPIILKCFYEYVFEAELNSWYTDPALWPANRDLKMFLEWFDVEFHSGVWDLCDDPIEVVDYGPEDDGEPGSNGK